MYQLKQPNTNIKGYVGSCLRYAREVFGLPSVYPSAWEAWQATKYKHTTETMPNVAVPVWFRYYGTINYEYKNWGHVVVYVPNKGFYSSPYNSTFNYNYFSSISMVEKTYNCTFVGWSEDINNVRVAQGVIMPTEQDVKDYFRVWVGKTPTSAELKSYTSRSWRYLADKILTLQKSRMGKVVKENQTLVAKIAENDRINAGNELEIYDLNNEVEEKTRKIRELQAQIDLASEDTQNLNKLAQIIKWLFVRLK